MDKEVFYNGNGFQIIPPPTSDPIIWTSRSIKTLATELIKAGAVQRTYFFTKGLNKISEASRLPSLFIDPRTPFNPLDKSDSDFFRNVELYIGDRGEEIRDFIKKLVDNKVILEDEFKIFKCDCGNLTIGKGFYCCCCKTDCRKKKRRNLYYLPSELKTIFFQPGKIIEGVIYHALESLSQKGLEIVTNYLFKEEGGGIREIDVAIKDAQNKLLIIHVTIDTRADRERTIFEKTLKNNIKTIFVSTVKEEKAESIIIANNALNNAGVCIWDIANDSKFPNNLVNIVKDYFSI